MIEWRYNVSVLHQTCVYIFWQRKKGLGDKLIRSDIPTPTTGEPSSKLPPSMASHIPNLNTLRRGRGRGRDAGRTEDSTVPSGKDRIVQGTDNDASVSRLSAVELGYLEDAYATALTPAGCAMRRLPIINRGETAFASSAIPVRSECATDLDTSPHNRNLRSHNSHQPARGPFSRPLLAGKHTEETDHLARRRVRHARLPTPLVASNTGLRLPRARFRRQHNSQDPRDSVGAYTAARIGDWLDRGFPGEWEWSYRVGDRGRAPFAVVPSPPC
jgi:hypothetical protein